MALRSLSRHVLIAFAACLLSGAGVSTSSYAQVVNEGYVGGGEGSSSDGNTVTATTITTTSTGGNGAGSCTMVYSNNICGQYTYCSLNGQYTGAGGGQSTQQACENTANGSGCSFCAGSPESCMGGATAAVMESLLQERPQPGATTAHGMKMTTPSMILRCA